MRKPGLPGKPIEKKTSLGLWQYRRDELESLSLPKSPGSPEMP